MRRPLLRLWLGGSAFSAVLALGCNHGAFFRSDPAPAAIAEPRSEDETENAENAADLPGGSVPTSFRTVAAPPAPTGLALPAPGCQGGRPIERAPGPLRLIQLASPVPAPAPVSTPEQVVVLERPRTATAGWPALKPVPQPGFAHAANYRWLVGRLRLLPDRETWSVRYAPADENERHGGSLTLVSPGLMDGFHDGQFVRVEGELVDPAPHEIEPGYRVRAIQVLDRY